MHNIVFYICGIITAGFGMLMIIPGCIDVYYGDNHTAFNTFLSSIISIIVGALFFLTFHGKFKNIGKRDIFFITLLIWIVVSAFCALPFYFNISEFDYTSSYFEAISALTTTGITAISTVDNMSRGLLFWRSLLQWIGGVGIVVMAIAILPILRVGGMQLFYSESSEKMNKTAPTMATIIYRICFVYISFTFLFGILLYLVEMTPFEAINFSFSSISTAGGNVIYDNSVGVFSNPLTFWLLTFEMLIGAIPFMFLFFLLKGHRSDLPHAFQVRYYLTYVFAIWVFISAYLWMGSDKSLFVIMTDVAFYVASFASTTGMVKGDYLSLGSFVVGMLFLLTIIGGCTGSTSGGLKIFRFQVILMVIKRYLNNMFNPHQIILIKYNDKKLDDDIITGIFVFVSVFIMTVASLTILMIATGIDALTSFTSILSCVVNNGFGFGDIMGENGSFGKFPDFNKWILSLAMLLGRLEFLTALVLLLPNAWKKH